MEQDFPVGYHRFHSDVGLNFQLNRFLPGGRLDEFRAAAERIHGLGDWKREMLALAEAAQVEGRLAHAACYFRTAEFFIPLGDPDKARAYRRFRELFEEVHRSDGYERSEVPFEGARLPVMRLPVEMKKDVIVVHGGFDSFMEELYLMACFLRDAGYEVILFEGPGQGAALTQHGLAMIAEWERPVRAVLDFFGVSQCSLVGISLGGYLATRAAAFEPRIRRVVAFDVLDDFLDCLASARGRWLGALLRVGLWLRAARLLNAVIARQMQQNLLVAWAIPHGMHVMGVDSPYAFFAKAAQFNTTRISTLVAQDYLLLAGAEDHYVPLRQFFRQAQRLTNVRSFTGRVFTRAEQAQNHCQVGNVGLALDTIVRWLDERLAGRPIAD